MCFERCVGSCQSRTLCCWGVLANSTQPWKRKCKPNFWHAVIVKSYVCVCVSRLRAVCSNSPFKQKNPQKKATFSSKFVWESNLFTMAKILSFLHVSARTYRASDGESPGGAAETPLPQQRCVHSGVLLVALKWWRCAGGVPLVALRWWRCNGGVLLAALRWRRSAGDVLLAALRWWRCNGGVLLAALRWRRFAHGVALVALCWRRYAGGVDGSIDGGIPLAAFRWRRSSGGVPLAALGWQHSTGGVTMAAFRWRLSAGGVLLATTRY